MARSITASRSFKDLVHALDDPLVDLGRQTRVERVDERLGDLLECAT